jgi:hypothetical protein
MSIYIFFLYKINVIYLFLNYMYIFITVKFLFSETPSNTPIRLLGTYTSFYFCCFYYFLDKNNGYLFNLQNLPYLLEYQYLFVCRLFLAFLIFLLNFLNLFILNFLMLLILKLLILVFLYFLRFFIFRFGFLSPYFINFI